MRSGLSGAYLPSVWEASFPRPRAASDAGPVDLTRAPLPRSTARRPCEANLHTKGRLKLQGQGGASWGVNTRDPARVRAPELLTRGPRRGWGNLGFRGPPGKVGGEKAEKTREVA